MKTIVTMFVILALLIAGPAMAGGHDDHGTSGTSSDAKSDAEANVDIRVGGDSSVSPRQFIGALPGPVGSFVNAPFAELGGWKPFINHSLFSIYTKERMENAAEAGSFSDRKGGFFYRMFNRPIKGVMHTKFSGTPDDKPITILNWEPTSKDAQLLGEFECEGYYGWPMGAALGQCLAEAKLRTNTDRVVVFFRVRRDPKNSGFSIGTGAAGAKMTNDAGTANEVAGAISLGGLIGTTKAYIDQAWDWYVLALNKGPINPPVTVAVTTPAPVPEAKAPPAAPTGLKVCDTAPVWKRIEELMRKIKDCVQFCFANLGFRKALGDAHVDMYVCTGDKEYLHKAIEQYQIAERNYLKEGTDVRNYQPEADKIIAQVYYNWAGCIRESLGRDAAMVFARSKNLERIPTGFAAIQ